MGAFGFVLNVVNKLKGINMSQFRCECHEGVEKKEPCDTVVRDLNRCTHYGEQYGRVLKKL